MVYPRFLCFCPLGRAATHSTTNPKALLTVDRRFFLGFILLFFLVGSGHYFLLTQQGLQPAVLFFWECYLGNFFFALCLLLALNKAFDRMSHAIAWIYLFASGLKFVLFFLLLQPLFKADGVLSMAERFSFFVPYFTALILETAILINRLNKL